MTEEILYYWDSEINGWVVTWHSTFTYTYDSSGNELEYIWNKWALEYNDWRFVSKKVSHWSELKTSVSNNEIDLQCNIYPNPTRDIITIETDRFDKYSIHITSMNGQLIYDNEMEGTSHQVDLSSFQKGVYFITVGSNKNVTTKKIIKL